MSWRRAALRERSAAVLLDADRGHGGGVCPVQSERIAQRQHARDGRHMGRCTQLLRIGGWPLAGGSRMGARGARAFGGGGRKLPIRRCVVQWQQRRKGSRSWAQAGERFRPVRHARQRVGMGRGFRRRLGARPARQISHERPAARKCFRSLDPEPHVERQDDRFPLRPGCVAHPRGLTRLSEGSAATEVNSPVCPPSLTQRPLKQPQPVAVHHVGDVARRIPPFGEHPWQLLQIGDRVQVRRTLLAPVAPVQVAPDRRM